MSWCDESIPEAQNHAGSPLRGTTSAFRSVVARLIGLASAHSSRAASTCAAKRLSVEKFLSAPPALPITIELKRSLRASVRPSSSRRRTRVMLDIVSVEDNKRDPVAVGGGKGRRVLLIKRVLVRVHDNDGNDGCRRPGAGASQLHLQRHRGPGEGAQGAAPARDTDRRRAADRAPLEAAKSRP